MPENAWGFILCMRFTFSGMVHLNFKVTLEDVIQNWENVFPYLGFGLFFSTFVPYYLQLNLSSSTSTSDYAEGKRILCSKFTAKKTMKLLWIFWQNYIYIYTEYSENFNKIWKYIRKDIIIFLLINPGILWLLFKQNYNLLIGTKVCRLWRCCHLK